MNPNSPILIDYYKYINQIIIYDKDNKYLQLKISNVIKHPFYNKPAFTFYDSKYIYLCEHCTLLEDKLTENKTILQEYIDKTIYYPNHYFTRELLTPLTPKVNNLFKVKSVLHNSINNKNYFRFSNCEDLRLAEDFTVYFDSKAYYKNFKYYEKIEEIEWINMFNLFETLSYDLLFYFSVQNPQTCKIKGYSFTQYEDKKWNLFPILFDTYTATYDIILEPKKKKFMKQQENKKKISYRKFFFRVKEELLEFEDIYSENDLKNLAQDLLWSYDNKVLHDVLQKKLNDLKTIKQVKKKKI